MALVASICMKCGAIGVTRRALSKSALCRNCGALLVSVQESDHDTLTRRVVVDLHRAYPGGSPELERRLGRALKRMALRGFGVETRNSARREQTERAQDPVPSNDSPPRARGGRFGRRRRR
jgi:hypothetical protein